MVVDWDMLGERRKLRMSVITGKRATHSLMAKDGTVDAHSLIVVWFTP